MQQLAATSRVQLREAVEAVGVGLGEDAERRVALVDDDHGAVGPLVDQRERVARSVLVRPSVIGVS